MLVIAFEEQSKHYKMCNFNLYKELLKDRTLCKRFDTLKLASQRITSALSGDSPAALEKFWMYFQIFEIKFQIFGKVILFSFGIVMNIFVQTATSKPTKCNFVQKLQIQTHIVGNIRNK